MIVQSCLCQIYYHKKFGIDLFGMNHVNKHILSTDILIQNTSFNSCMNERITPRSVETI